MADRDTTTIQIDADTWRALNSRKNPGESFDDVIRRLLGKPARDDAPTGDTDDFAASVRAQLDDVDDETTDAVIACVEYLRAAGEASPGDFRENVFPDNSAGSTNGDWWWSKKIRPHFETLDEVDYVNQRTIRFAG